MISKHFKKTSTTTKACIFYVCAHTLHRVHANLYAVCTCFSVLPFAFAVTPGGVLISWINQPIRPLRQIPAVIGWLAATLLCQWERCSEQGGARRDFSLSALKLWGYLPKHPPITTSNLTFTFLFPSRKNSSIWSVRVVTNVRHKTSFYFPFGHVITGDPPIHLGSTHNQNKLIWLAELNSFQMNPPNCIVFLYSFLTNSVLDRKYPTQPHKVLQACTINVSAATVILFNAGLLFQGVWHCCRGTRSG